MSTNNKGLKIKIFLLTKFQSLNIAYNNLISELLLHKY